MSFRRLYFCALTLGITCLVVSSCKDDEPVDPVPDLDAGEFPEVGLPETKAKQTKFTATFVTYEVKDQPKAGVPSKTFPNTVIQVNNTISEKGMAKLVRSRKPDVTFPGSIPVEPIRCDGWKFPTPDITDPRGPNYIYGDVGVVKVEGNSGVGPFECQRIDLTGPANRGIFNYVCGGPNVRPFPTGDFRIPNLALPHDAVPNFLEPTDKIVYSATGGRDIKALPKGESLPTVAPHNLVVTTDLWNITPDMVDGSKDLVVEYNCGGGPCKDGDLMMLQILSTDVAQPPIAADTDGGTPKDLERYQFPLAKQDGGFILCHEQVAQASTSFRLDKSILSVLGPWKTLNTQIVVFRARPGASADNDMLIYVSGYGVTGFTVRR